MFELLEKIRQKSDRTKKQIAFLIALFISGIIFVIWLTVIMPDWQDSERRNSNVVSNEPTPTSALTSTFSEGFSSIGEQYQKIKDAISGYTFPVKSTSTSADTSVKMDTLRP